MLPTEEQPPCLLSLTPKTSTCACAGTSSGQNALVSFLQACCHQRDGGTWASRRSCGGPALSPWLPLATLTWQLLPASEGISLPGRLRPGADWRSGGADMGLSALQSCTFFCLVVKSYEEAFVRAKYHVCASVPGCFNQLKINGSAPETAARH